MTAHELIQELENFDPDVRVEFWLPENVIVGEARIFDFRDAPDAVGVLVVEPCR